MTTNQHAATTERDTLAELVKATVFSPHAASVTTWQAIADAVIAAGWRAAPPVDLPERTIATVHTDQPGQGARCDVAWCAGSCAWHTDLDGVQSRWHAKDYPSGVQLTRLDVITTGGPHTGIDTSFATYPPACPIDGWDPATVAQLAADLADAARLAGTVAR